MKKFLIIFMSLLLLCSCQSSGEYNVSIKRILNCDVGDNMVIMSPVGEYKLELNGNDLSNYITLTGEGKIEEAKYSSSNRKVYVKVSNGKNVKEFNIQVETESYTHPDKGAEATLTTKETKAKSITDGKILLVGDSLFANWKNPESDLGNFNVVNFGVGGFTTSDLINYVFPRLIQVVNPSKIVMHVGVNDIFQGGYSLDTYLQNIEKFIGKINKYFPSTQIYFVSIVRPTDNVKTVTGVDGAEADARRDAIDEANEYMKSYSMSHSQVTYIDGESAYENALGRSDTKNFYPDGIHLVDAVYPTWGEIIGEYLV